LAQILANPIGMVTQHKGDPGPNQEQSDYDAENRRNCHFLSPNLVHAPSPRTTILYTWE
jgi:hypothetical protein